MVFVHGANCDADFMVPLVAHLDAMHNCIAIDRPPYQRSYNFNRETTVDEQVEAIRAVHETCSPKPAWVFGHSSGGNFALAYATSYPEKVQGLVLMEPALYAIYPSDDLPIAVVRYHDEVLTAARRGDLETAFGIFLEILEFDDPEMMAGLENLGLLARSAENLEHFGKELDAVLSWCPSVEALRRIDCPTLLIEGDQTTPVLRDIVAMLARHLPAATVSTVTGGNHMAPQLRPEVVASFVRNFVSTL